MKFIDFEKLAALFLKYWDKFLIDGVEYTLALAAITVAFGTVFASVLALMKMSKIPPLRWLSAIYIEIIRGTPMLLQLYFFYFGLPMLIPALSLNHSFADILTGIILFFIIATEFFITYKVTLRKNSKKEA